MRAFRTVLTWSLIAHLVGFAVFFVIGCGGGGGGGGSASPVSPATETVWSTSLTQVQEALKTATGTWTAAETSVSLGFSETDAAALCGMVADPLLSSFTAAVKADVGVETVLAVAPNGTSLPRRFTWREKDGKDWTSPVKNQGRYGTCVAFAAIAALEMSLKIAQQQSGVSYDFSEWHLWHLGTKGKSPAPGGWFPSGAVECLKTRGAVSEDLCPYTAIPSTPTPPSDARWFPISNWSVVSGRSALKQALLEGPVMAAMRVRSDFCFYRGGIYSPVAGRELGDHAILLIGYDDDQGCWIAQNSWSASWGENGFFRIKYGQINDQGLRVAVTKGTAAGQTQTSSGTDEAMLGFPNPVVQLGPYVREVTATSAVICWATDQSTTAQVEYGAGPTFSRVAQKEAPAATHSMPLLGLQESTAYQFQVTSTTPTGQTIRSNVQSFITLSVGSAPVVAPAIFNVNVTGITKTSAMVSWSTDQAATGKIYYVTGTIASTASDLRLRTAHSITLNNLQGGTTYSFYVEASASSLVAVSDTSLFTTLDSTPPAISEVSVPTPTLSGTKASVVWLTDEAATSQVEYGFSPAYGQLTNLVPTLTFGHQVNLTNLLPQTTYHYRVRSKDANGNEGTSSNGTFTTPDSVPPVLSTIRTSPITGTTATINFTTNETATVQVEYGPGAFTAITAPETNTTFSILLSGLTPKVVYKFRVRAKDAANNEAVTADLQFTTVDSAAPVISNISVAPETLTGTTAQVTWLTDEAATTQVEYGLTAAYGLSTTIDTTKVTGHLAKLIALLPNTTYNYRVRSKDVSGNETVSGNNTFTTLDSQPPTISNIRVLPITGTTGNVTFTTSKPATIVIEYGVGIFSALASTTTLATTHEILLSGLLPKSAYRYRIYATDSAGNVGISAILSFTTLDTVPPVITGIIVSSITNTSATVAWTTDKAATSQVIWGSSTTYDKGPIVDSTLLKNHSIKINLDDSSVPIWNFQVSSTDAAGNVATSTNQTFQVPLYLYDVNVTAIGTDSATIVWNSNATASSLVEYGLSSLYGNQAYTLPFPNTGTRNHSVTVSGLVPFATYYFRVRSKEPTGREAVSQGFSF
ncbi:MAG TPA: fibronectin type III domain-containing protein, partial [Candidatus Ozemobacteraceae bacterium]|nr:fibronectin type III domain-containing protein [Candidatus Ozemobacteraceae bacterium]